MLSKSLKVYQTKKIATFTVLIATVPFKKVLLAVYTAVPTFLPQLKAVLEVLFVSIFQHLLQFGLNLLYRVISSHLQLDFHHGEEEEVTGGLNQASKRDGGRPSCFWRPKSAVQPKQYTYAHGC